MKSNLDLIKRLWILAPITLLSVIIATIPTTAQAQDGRDDRSAKEAADRRRAEEEKARSDSRRAAETSKEQRNTLDSSNRADVKAVAERMKANGVTSDGKTISESRLGTLRATDANAKPASGDTGPARGRSVTENTGVPKGGGKPK